MFSQLYNLHIDCFQKLDKTCILQTFSLYTALPFHRDQVFHRRPNLSITSPFLCNSFAYCFLWRALQLLNIHNTSFCFKSLYLKRHHLLLLSVQQDIWCCLQECRKVFYHAIHVGNKFHMSKIFQNSCDK